MKSIEELKRTPHLMIRSVGEDGGCGEIVFEKLRMSVVWSNGLGWEHVSVAPYNHRYTPSWDDMCVIKHMFFHDDEYAVEYHPPKSEYVNNLPNCLHLWRPIEQTMPVPPSIMVGIKNDEIMNVVMKRVVAYDMQALHESYEKRKNGTEM